MLLLSVEKMKELEKQADAQGYSYVEMMKSAGGGLADDHRQALAIPG